MTKESSLLKKQNKTRQTQGHFALNQDAECFNHSFTMSAKTPDINVCRKYFFDPAVRFK